MECFNISKGDIITITGAGGKTSLMFSLARYLAKKGRVLVTTTTKIFVPSAKDFEKLCVDNSDISGSGKNIFVYGSKIQDNKLFSLGYDKIKELSAKFDYVLIEGDGAKRKKIKAWEDYEPCIPNFSTKIVGVVNADILGSLLDEDRVHRFSIFKQKFSRYLNSPVDKDFLVEYIKNGDFFKVENKNIKNKNIKKYIFFNGIDGKDYLDKFSVCLSICNILHKDFNFILGSVSDNIFFKFLPTEAVVLASGYSRRMGKDKLKLPYKDISILEHTLKKLSLLPFYGVYVCGREDFTKELAKKYKVHYLHNSRAELGQSEGIKLGVENSRGEGIAFFPGDQPLLSQNTILLLYYNFLRYNLITIPKVGSSRFSPVFFPQNKKEELLNLSGDVGGREVIKNTTSLNFVEFENDLQFMDIDTPQEYEFLTQNF